MFILLADEGISSRILLIKNLTQLNTKPSVSLYFFCSNSRYTYWHFTFLYTIRICEIQKYFIVFNYNNLNVNNWYTVYCSNERYISMINFNALLLKSMYMTMPNSLKYTIWVLLYLFYLYKSIFNLTWAYKIEVNIIILFLINNQYI